MWCPHGHTYHGLDNLGARCEAGEVSVLRGGRMRLLRAAGHSHISQPTDVRLTSLPHLRAQACVNLCHRTVLSLRAARPTARPHLQQANVWGATLR